MVKNKFPLLVLLLLIISATAQCQWNLSKDNYSTGKVSIGSSDMTNNNQLYIYSSNSKTLLKVKNSLDYDAGIEFETKLANYKIGAGIGSATSSFVIYDLKSSKNRMMIDSKGQIGIGITSPTSKLHIYGNSGSLLKVENNLKSDAGIEFKTSLANFKIGAGVGSATNSFVIYDLKSNKNRMMINSTGQIGINTTTMGNHKLAVNGSIGAREINVDLHDWPDFVFDEGYDQLPILELDKYIKKHNHLPNIPSEKEVLENGINVGEMNAKLLQKIEELTLYMIEQNKEIEKLKNNIEYLTQEIKK